jgi:type II secretory pathway component GspD/PulD (secretin)
MATAQGTAQVPAQAPPLRPLAVTQLDEQKQGTDLESTRPITVTLSDPTPITDLLFMLVRDTRLSVVPDADVQGTFRGELKDVTLRQALEMILEPHGYDYSVQGNLIRVFRRRFETRRFDLNYVITRRVGSRTLAASNAIAPSGTPGANASISANAQGSSADVTATDAGDIFADVAVGVQTLLSPEGRFNMDKKAALLQATDFPERLDQIQLYLDAVQHRSTRQVQIQAKVIEIELSDAFGGGIDWDQVTGEPVSVTQDVTALLKALESRGKVNVLANPMVIAMNNEPAIMRVATQDVFFKTTTHTDAASGRVLQTTVEPQAISEGVVLSVTPQIAGDGMINMSIMPTLTERTGHATSRLGDKVPIVRVREANTLIRVHENQTIVIAGLMDESMYPEQRKVPVLGHLPGLGAIFRSQTMSRRKTELVILLTPTIMTPARVAQATAEALERVR